MYFDHKYAEPYFLELSFFMKRYIGLVNFKIPFLNLRDIIN